MRKKSILTLTIQVSIITFCIKVLGLVKQSVLAAYCGATAETDAFFIATGILINLCTVLFSALSISLLSMHAKRLIADGRESSNQLINAVLRTFIPIAILISLVFFTAATPISHFLAPSYDSEQLVILSRYVRIMSVSFVLWCYFLTINVVLETDKRFLPGRFQGFFQNVLLIVAAIVLYRRFGIASLIYAFLLSGLLECILVTWCARKEFRIVFGKIDAKSEIKKLIELSIPLIIGNAIYEINDIVDKQLSTELGTGNASFLTYGSTINDIIIGVIVASVSSVLFTHYVTWIAEGEISKVEKNLERTIEYLTILILPIMVMCIVAGDQIVEILYGRGSFGAAEISSTYDVVMGYAIGFVFQAARSNIVKVYYAFQNTKVPMINGAIAVGTNVVLCIVLSKTIGIFGISLATSIAMCIVTLLLLRGIHQYLPNFSIRKCQVECLKGLIAAVVIAFVVRLLKSVIVDNIYVSFLCEGAACVFGYLAVMLGLKSECVREICIVVLEKVRH